MANPEQKPNTAPSDDMPYPKRSELFSVERAFNLPRLSSSIGALLLESSTIQERETPTRCARADAGPA